MSLPANDLPVMLGMTLAEARAALDAAQIVYELHELGGVRLSFTRDGTPYQAHLDEVVAFITAHHELPTFDEALAIVRRHVAHHGEPLQVLHDFQPRMPHEMFGWIWPGLEIPLFAHPGDASTSYRHDA